jgi:hypothetical protein
MENEHGGHAGTLTASGSRHHRKPLLNHTDSEVAAFGTKTLRVAFTVREPNERRGIAMRNDPFKSMNDAACRNEIMSSIGRQLDNVYSPILSAPIPQPMTTLPQLLTSCSAASTARKPDGAA